MVVVTKSGYFSSISSLDALIFGSVFSDNMKQDLTTFILKIINVSVKVSNNLAKLVSQIPRIPPIFGMQGIIKWHVALFNSIWH